MTDNQGRKLYGVTELAERLGIPPVHVRVKLSRSRKSGVWSDVPPPDEVLVASPVWYADTIDKWLAER